VVGDREVLTVEFYTGVDERLDVPVVLPPTLDQVDLTGANVLVADDVADTGKTPELVCNFYAEYVAEVRTAVNYEKPPSVASCDYVWRTTDRWIDFPWSTLPPVRRREGVTGVRTSLPPATRKLDGTLQRGQGLRMKAAAVGSPPPPPSLRSLR
jgi:hypothetical protein